MILTCAVASEGGFVEVRRSDYTWWRVGRITCAIVRNCDTIVMWEHVQIPAMSRTLTDTHRFKDTHRYLPPQGDWLILVSQRDSLIPMVLGLLPISTTSKMLVDTHHTKDTYWYPSSCPSYKDIHRYRPYQRLSPTFIMSKTVTDTHDAH